jgi:hypothetical protein
MIILLVLSSDLQYVTGADSRQCYTLEQYPAVLGDKVVAIIRLKNHMNKRLFKAGAKHANGDGNAISHYPYMVQRRRTERWILMQLSNGTIQVSIYSRE